ncbi:MFS transporter [Streptomyces mirabilis]
MLTPPNEPAAVGTPDGNPMPFAGPGPTADPHYARRWLILVVLSLAQFMVIVDATVINVALPSAQQALGFSDGNRQWLVTAYALAFGSLLLLGGRLSDLFGRKYTFVAGAAGFAAASALGGAAQSFGVLVSARVLQGVCAAVLAPAALSLVNSTFLDRDERNKAYAIFTTIAGLSGGIGLVLGGVVTDYLSWRWSLFVNIFIALPAVVGGMILLTNKGRSPHLRLDVPGTAAASSGLFGIVFGFAKAQTDGWGAAVTVAPLIAGAALLVVFAAIQVRVAHPLLPLRIVGDRTRGGSLLVVFVSGIGLFSAFLFLTYFMQDTLQFSPLRTGLGFLPLIFGLLLAAGASQSVLAKVGPRPLYVVGMTTAAGGLALLAQLDSGSSWAGGVLPGLLVLGLGLGISVPASFNTATSGVPSEDSGAASAVVDVSQQVGIAVGLAALSSVATRATTSYLHDRPHRADVLAHASVHGYTVAFWAGSAVFVIGAAAARLLVAAGPITHVHQDEPSSAVPSL